MKYNVIGAIAILMIIFGLLSVMVFPSAFSYEVVDEYTGISYPMYNNNFSFLGIVLVIVGGILLFYARYKYTAEEEKKRIEKMKKGE